jgi:hypothetical protein
MTRGTMRVCGWGTRSDYVGTMRRRRTTVAITSMVWSWETMRQGVATLSCRRRGEEVRSGRGHEESRRQGDAMWGLGQQPEVMDAMWGRVDHQQRGGAGEVLWRGGGVKEVCRRLGGAWEDPTSAQEQGAAADARERGTGSRTSEFVGRQSQEGASRSRY